MVAVVISVRWQSASLAGDVLAHPSADFRVGMLGKRGFHRRRNLSRLRFSVRAALFGCQSFLGFRHVRLLLLVRP
jgi:hypothetical protein